MFIFKARPLLGCFTGFWCIVAPFFALEILLLWQSRTEFGAFGWVTLHFIISFVLAAIYLGFSVWKICATRSIKWKVIDFPSLLSGEFILLSPYLFENAGFNLAMSWFPHK